MATPPGEGATQSYRSWRPPSARRGRGARRGRASGGWLARRRSREVRESFFGGENSCGTPGPARGRRRGGLGTGTGLPAGQVGRTGASRGPIAQQRIPGAPAREAFPAPGSGPPKRCGPGGVGGLGAPYSATRLRSRCGRSGHVPRPQAARRGRRVSATPLPQPPRGRSSAPPTWLGSSTPAPGSRLPATRAVPALAPPRASPHARAPAPPRGPHCPPHRDRVHLPSGVMNGSDPGVLWLKPLPGVPAGSGSCPPRDPCSQDSGPRSASPTVGVGVGVGVTGVPVTPGRRAARLLHSMGASWWLSSKSAARAREPVRRGPTRRR